MNNLRSKNERLLNLIEPIVDHLGYALVRVQLSGSGKTQTLQIMAERNDNNAMTVDDCETISKQISAVMDVEDPIGSAYQLEVSSPGIDRPLTRLEDFTRFAGFLALVELQAPHVMPDGKGRKRFQGKLVGASKDSVKLTGEASETWEFSFDNIAKAKLVLTDELIKAQVSN